jgi:hypothetical protein
MVKVEGEAWVSGMAGGRELESARGAKVVGMRTGVGKAGGATGIVGMG